MSQALVGLGSNVGDRAANLNRAIELLGETPGVEVLRVSSWRETTPIGGPPGQDPFLNGAALLETSLGPHPLHEALTRIEDQLGRRRQVRWEARTLDLDLLLYDSLQLATPSLVLPHPRFAFRRFVIEPAAEIAPELIHPTVSWRLAKLRNHLLTSKPYVAITGMPGTGKTQLAHNLAEHFFGRAITSPRLPAAAAEPLATGTSGRALAGELELLAERAALLSPPSWPAEAPLVVSDFWLGQMIAYSWPNVKALDSAARATAIAQYRGVGCSTASPRLVVLLSRLANVDGPELPEPISAPGRLLERNIDLYARQYGGLVLRLPTNDPETAWTELTAAVAAMA